MTLTREAKIWNTTPKIVHDTVLAHIKFYLDNFIGIIQGSDAQKKMTRHLFMQIDSIFCANGTEDIAREELISLNKLGKGGK